ncbi:unnamed protein product [Didymodactylos carnosus]|uniref:Uncharacterized protein n=1 Tax=Didymodactylos carnosus TaxID=1234261 RepID=A0A814JL51_9BILA|nr:unnamed protein product [Didymodactylos carnosus]CAF1037307.1 unnamed protein product [Didymodactylos carnosus]CAF3764049.1 unnamed protein product [Didymodactylos carnosus]CAF3807806.1 unnamed protein product [Didymodactylos carnosus]
MGFGTVPQKSTSNIQINTLYQQQEHKELILTVYRGQIRTHKKLQILQNNEGNLISMNTFLLTTKNISAALLFSEQDKNSTLKSVLFQITIDTKSCTTKPFAFITTDSHMKIEEEVLLTIGTIFQIESVEEFMGRDKGVDVASIFKLVLEAPKYPTTVKFSVQK